MPEGDTIHRTAEVLRRALVGSRVVAARAQPRPGLARVPRLSRLAGARVDSVEARGKHLLIGFSGGWWLRTHMRMRGSWHRYAPGDPWRLPAARATCVLETDTAVAVCFDAPELELLGAPDLARHAALGALGPDLLAPGFHVAEAVRRLMERSSVPLGVALLDQRALAGIGNVYKSEACFLGGLDPWAPVASFTEGELRAAVESAAHLLAANVGGGRRVTTGRSVVGGSVAGRSAVGGLWVYRRTGRPCRRCGTPIRGRRQGEQARMTYWCPACQPSRS
ncbi:MAG: Fpg/Nei family DNA glycosylase [Candidatus Limnocylindria bacterium]